MQVPAASSVTTTSAATSWRAKTTLCLLLGLITGCGQKGPLTLPDAGKKAPAAAASAPR
jgi:predicted small lipoprotein YifL